MEEIIVLTLLILGLLVYVYRSSFVLEEGFEEEKLTLSACPSGMKSFYLPDDSTGCCAGTISGNRCLDGAQCTMTGAGSAQLPNCGAYLLKIYREKAKEQCPKSMPSYYEDPTAKKKGCTSGPLNADHSRPLHSDQPTCVVYTTTEESRTMKDSCLFQKEMEDFPCPSANCTKSILKPEQGPPLVAIHFKDEKGMYRTAYTRSSLENYLSRTRPRWKEEGIDLQKNLMVAEVAKAFYLDRTITKNDVQWD